LKKAEVAAAAITDTATDTPSQRHRGMDHTNTTFDKTAHQNNTSTANDGNEISAGLGLQHESQRTAIRAITPGQRTDTSRKAPDIVQRLASVLMRSPPCRTLKLSSRGNCGHAKPWQSNTGCRGLLQRLVRQVYSFSR
jgi:hypothetical protein